MKSKNKLLQKAYNTCISVDLKQPTLFKSANHGKQHKTLPALIGPSVQLALHRVLPLAQRAGSPTSHVPWLPIEPGLASVIFLHLEK